MNAREKANTIIVGGGWAGLSCASYLTQQQQSFTLYESSRQLGGRARGAKFDQFTIDNGQHILVGACKETLKLLKLLGIEEKTVLQRQKLELKWRNLDKSPSISLNAAHFPAPLHLVIALIKAHGLNFKEKSLLIKLLIQLKIKKFKLPRDQALYSFLSQKKQTDNLIVKFWEPMCLAILNTPIKIASAQIFFKVLADSFDQQADYSDSLLFKKNLNQILPEPVKNYLEEQQNQTIQLSQKVSAIEIKDNQVQAVQVQQQRIACKNLVLATPISTTQRLLNPHQDNDNISQMLNHLSHFDFQPIMTAYLKYESACHLPEIMSGLLGGYSQWVFDHRLTGQSELLAVVISGEGAHLEIDKSSLVNIIDKELRSLFPLPRLIKGIISHEKKATFSCTEGIGQYRPKQLTPVKGLYLAGDYTQTGYPSTLEGAIISGKNVAQLIVNQN